VLSDNLELESLSGIALGPSLVNINLIDSPKLTSIAELAPVTQAFTLYLSNLGITDLESLENLAVVESGISLTGNANLVDVERLAGVSTESLIINENPAVTSIPALREMWFLESFTVVGNPELQSINIDLPQHGGGPDAIQDSLLVDPIKVIDIGRNDKLTQVSLTAGLEQGRFLAIYANPALERVALGSLTRLESLSVTGNPSLTSLDPGALQTVESLSVIDNPSLDTAPLGAIRTFESTLGNVEEPAAAP
jgi:Leucine-rich repeat (LRR) protein